MNLQTGEWDKNLCRLFEVPIEILPRIVPTTGNFGFLTIADKRIAVTASVCDQQASLYGHGCRKPGDTKITFGTGAFALAITGDQPIQIPKKGLLPTVAWQLNHEPIDFALDGGVYNAGAAINWAKSLGLFSSFEQINQFPQKSAVSQQLIFIPALSGLACPHWDRKAAGLWIGLSLDTSPLDMMQALLEGIAFRTMEVIEAMSHVVTVKNVISIDGGLSNNPYFCQFLANLLNKKISVPQFSEVTAVGTALLASGHLSSLKSVKASCKYYVPNENMGEHKVIFNKAIQRAKDWY